MTWQWFSPLVRMKLTSLMTSFTMWLCYDTDLHRASWWIMQCKKTKVTNCIQRWVFLFHLLLDFFSSPMFFPVKFGDPTVMTFASLHYGCFSLSMTPDNLSYKSTPHVVTFMDSMAKYSTVISKLSLIPFIIIRGCVVSFDVTFIQS